MTLDEAQRNFNICDQKLRELRDSRKTLQGRHDTLEGRRASLMVNINSQPDPLIRSSLNQQLSNVNAELATVGDELKQCKNDIVIAEQKLLEARNALNAALVAAGQPPLPEPPPAQPAQ